MNLEFGYYDLIKDIIKGQGYIGVGVDQGLTFGKSFDPFSQILKVLVATKKHDMHHLVKNRTRHLGQGKPSGFAVVEIDISRIFSGDSRQYFIPKLVRQIEPLTGEKEFIERPAKLGRRSLEIAADGARDFQ